MSSEGTFKPLILLAKQAFFQMSCISLASLKKTLTVFLKSSGTIEGVNSADKWTDPVRNLFKELIVKLLVDLFLPQSPYCYKQFQRFRFGNLLGNLLNLNSCSSF